MRTSFFEVVGADPESGARRLMQTAQNRDGLPEIAIGAVLFVVAFLIWLQVAYRPGTLAYKMSSWGMVILMPAMIGGSTSAIQWVRRKFLIDRVGYVE